MVANVEKTVYKTEKAGAYQLVYVAYQPTTGISSASLSVNLRKNTLVRRFDVIVRAARAQQTHAADVAQVRSASTATAQNVVIDFGVPRTVSLISVDGANVLKVRAWTGAAFATSPFYSGTTSDAVFASEVRSERLLVELGTIPSDLGRAITLELPELPSDLEIRINGGAPVWSNPGPVQPTNDAALSTTAWNRDAERIVPLADALNALLGDPLSDSESAYEIKLTAKVPGVLDIREAQSAGHQRSLSYISRILFDHDAGKTLDFVQEGLVELPLTITPPRARRVEEVRLTATASLPPERTMPAVGPSAASTPQTPVLAELMLDADHAACVRLAAKNDAGEELAELTGIRLPLAAGDSGAEVRVVLWGDEASEPSAPLPNATGNPVTLQASSGTDLWTRFDFPKPVAIDAQNPPWLAVLVSRGTVWWALGALPPTGTAAVTPDDVLLPANVLRRGGPNGPWYALPQPFSSPSFMVARGRVRVIGSGAKTEPVAPLLMRVFAAWKPVTPTAKGIPVTIAGNAVFGSDPRLLVVSRTAGTVALRDVDVVWQEA